MILLLLFFLIMSNTILHRKTTPKRPRFRLWTFPVLVDGPLGIVSAAELIGILLFSLYIIWAVSVYTLQDLKTVSDYHLPSMEAW